MKALAIVGALLAATALWAGTVSETGVFLTPEDTSLISGGFDPFVGLFSGTGPTALFLNGDSDILSNYTPGCPPAGTLTVGGVSGQCGDVNDCNTDTANWALARRVRAGKSKITSTNKQGDPDSL